MDSAKPDEGSETPDSNSEVKKSGEPQPQEKTEIPPVEENAENPVSEEKTEEPTVEKEVEEIKSEDTTEKQTSKDATVKPNVTIPSASEVGSLAKTSKTKFEILNKLIKAVEVSDRDVVDAVFNLLVGGDFDLEVNFIIQDEQCIIYMLETMEHCSAQCKAEIWSKFKGICRKSYRNLQACVEVGLVQRLLSILANADDVTSELIIDMLSLLMSYNISVKELKQLLSMLKGENGKWPPHAVKLLGILQSTTERHGPDCFFNFPGKKDAAIALPPLKSWPYANGFTFTTWFRMDPLNSLRVDVDKPYIYCFRNSKGMGYSGHFVGSCFIVTVLKSKGKGFQHCLKYEFKPRKWYQVTIVHIYNRWRSSEIKCYANGQMVSCCEMNWSIGGSEQYDKCFLGSAETGDESRVFCGQMAATYVFSEALSPSQVYALYQLGPGYKNQFKFPTESDHLLANHHKKVLYEDGKLADALVLAYNPKSTDGQLCLECSPKTNQRDGSVDVHRWFVHNPHALMLPEVKAIVTHSIHSALHSVGGAEVLFPLFSQLDYTQPDGSMDTTVCYTLLNFLQQLIHGSTKTQQQVLQGKGFLVIGTLLEKATKDHITDKVLDTFISMSKFLDQLPNGMPLMRQFCDYILFNPAMWIHTDPKVQLSLYTYLATEFVTSPTIQTNVRRVSTLLLLIHALKHYYWVVNPEPRSGIIPKGLDGPRPSTADLLSLRAFILLFLKQLVTRTGNILEDELQAVLGYLLTVHEDENVIDVLQLLVALLSEHGSTVVPVFDHQNGLMVIFKLLGSRSNNVRVNSLKLLAYFLKQLPEKRKEDLMDAQSLFMLIGERLLIYSDEMGVETYNALYEVLVQEPNTQILHNPHHEPSLWTVMHNPAMMKVIAIMLQQISHNNPAAMQIKIIFLNDLLKLFHTNRDNRRILLQQSVWQDWMLSLGYVHPSTKDEHTCQELVYQIFKVLLYHAVKLEWGGWRVWVDTLSIVHSKVSFEEHKKYMEQMYQDYQQSEERKKTTGQVSAITGTNNPAATSIEVVDHDTVQVVIKEVPDGDDIAEQEPPSKSEDTAQNEPALQNEEEKDEQPTSHSDEPKNAEVEPTDDGGDNQDTDGAGDDNEEKKLDAADREEQELEQETQETSSAQDDDLKKDTSDVDESSDGQQEDVTTEQETDQDNAKEQGEEDLSENEKEGSKPDDASQTVEPKDVTDNDETKKIPHVDQDAEEIGSGDAKESGEEEDTCKEDMVDDDKVEGSEKDQPSQDTDPEASTEDAEKDEKEENKDSEDQTAQEESSEATLDKEPLSKEEDTHEEETETSSADMEQKETLPEEPEVDEAEKPTAESSEDEKTATNDNKDTTPKDKEVASGSNEEEGTSSKDVETAETSAADEDKVDVDKAVSSGEENPLNVTPLKDQDAKKQAEEQNDAGSQVEGTGTPPQDQQQFSPGPRTVVFRVPEFKWSEPHLRLLDDLFTCLEGDIESWKSSSTPIVDIVNANDNVIFVHNTVHLFSQMTDNILLACGGILPILSSATSPTYELDTIEAGQGLSMEAAWSIINRLSSFMDVLAFASTVNFAEVEHEKNMSAGGVLRQCLRTACICAVRNCLESRYLKKFTSAPPTPGYLSGTQSHGYDQKAVMNGDVETDEENEADVNVSAMDAAEILLSLMSNTATPIVSHHMLLQEADVNRLRSIIYRDIDDTKQAQYLALAVVYFVSVLMVSKYRDILDPESHRKLQQATVARRSSPKKKKLTGPGVSFPSAKVQSSAINVDPTVAAATITNGHTSSPEASKASHSEGTKASTSTNVQDILRNLAKRSDSPLDVAPSTHERVSPNSFPMKVTSVGSSYQSFDRSVKVKSKEDEQGEDPQEAVTISTAAEDGSLATAKEIKNGEADHTDLPQIDPSTMNITEDEADVSARLERSMDQLAPLLRDIFLDFSSFLSKTLLGTHGQELLVEGLVCMKSYSSVVELVMLLCSQEWQNSIQKHAGLAFIELINEGRLLCHAMKDHVVRVANEADFILSKQRAEDVKRHAQFESSSAVFLAQQRDEERQCDSLITAAKHRDHATALGLKNRITNILTNKLGAWGSNFNSCSREYWRLDPWEDDTRRRRRFVRNPYGSSHPEATLMTEKMLNAVLDASDPGSMPRSPSNFNPQGADQAPPVEEEIMPLDDVDQEDLQGPVAFTAEADLIAPGVCLHGNLSITPDEFFFEVIEHHQSFTKADPKVLAYIDGIHGKWTFQEVRAIFSRRFLLQNTAIEVFLANRTCVLFNFSDNDTVKKVIGHLPRVGIGTGYGLPQARRISLASPRQLLKSSNMMERWQRREISNFEYLMFINTIAGRTFNDLNQYPVFPWVISNYEANELDLSLPSNYRDLSKPIGALNPKRATYFQTRYDNWDDPQIPKFHYGTHYSNAAFTLGWLVRVEPFTTMFLNLQGGKFDHADRTFQSIQQSWKNCQRDSHDVKELIPEFYYLPEMFVNSNDYVLGQTTEACKVHDVILPPWAKSADDFVRVNRMALESEIVSCQLHQWIDLIFGFKQRGPEAVRATNVFYYLTYEGMIDLQQISDPVERTGLTDQIRNFGQTPSQLLTNPHLPRSSAMHVTPMMFKERQHQDLDMVLKFQSNSPVVHVAANTHPRLHSPAVITCTKNLHFSLNKWNKASDSKSSSAPSSADNDKQPALSIEPDSLISLGGGPNKRQIADTLDQSVKVTSSCFVVTADNRFLVSCGYWDRSFRINMVDSGKLNQVVFGHWDVVTCLSRSETYIGGDCYFVTGSRDATVMLWYWSGRRSLIIGDSSSADENPTARAVLTGHDTEITCAAVCAELGLIASGSVDGPLLLHTITGDLLRTLEPGLSLDNPEPTIRRPELLLFTGEGMIIAAYNDGLICNFTMNGRSLTSRIINDNLQAIVSSSNSQYLITGGDKGLLQIWRAWDFKHLYSFPLCDVGICSVALTHDQKTIVTGMTSGSIVAFHVNFNKWHYEYQDKF
uniref:Neurobeachin n=1 Tax=Phallusia mammillata TaxID=59560 RepID=A0A6F9DL89_9ASCI|nr:neurobeachin [Phallusia mammillata]